MNITMRKFLAVVNTGLALYCGWLAGFIVFFSMAMSHESERLTLWIGLVVLVLVLTFSVVAGWLIALKKHDSHVIKFLAFLPVPFYVYVCYMLISSELEYRYNRSRDCSNFYSEKDRRTIIKCEQLKNGKKTDVIYYEDVTTGKRLEPPMTP